MRLLVLYFTFTGQAARVAEGIEAAARSRGSTAVPCRIDFAAASERLQAPVSFAVIRRWGDQAKRAENVPVTLTPDSIAARDFDAVVVLSNTWTFLPAAPVQSFLRETRARELLQDKPVAIGIVCRGFWTKNLRTTTALVQAAGGRVVTHEVFRHEGSWLRSTITNVNGMTKPQPIPTRLGPLSLPPFGVSPASMAKIPAFVQRLLDAGR